MSNHHLHPQAVTIDLNEFQFESFSTYEIVLEKIVRLARKAACLAFNCHSWALTIIPRDEWGAGSIRAYRSFCARELTCSCCGVVSHVSDARMSQHELEQYNWSTLVAYENQ